MVIPTLAYLPSSYSCLRRVKYQKRYFMGFGMLSLLYIFYGDRRLGVRLPQDNFAQCFKRFDLKAYSLVETSRNIVLTSKG